MQENTDNINTSSTQKTFKKKGSLVFYVLISIILGLSILLILSNTHILFKSTPLCDAKVINEFNNVYFMPDGTEKIGKIVNNIKKNNDYESDPTCMQILYSHSVLSEDLDSAYSQYETIKKLNEKGLRPDLQLFLINTIPSMSELFNNEPIDLEEEGPSEGEFIGRG